MSEDHKPLPVAGYTPQSDANVALANELKYAEERYLRLLDKILSLNTEHAIAVNGMFGNPALPIDPRMVALAKTKMQEANMWAVRAIFQPGRISLPEDK